MACTQFLSRIQRPRLAYHQTPGRSPGVVFLPGFMSNMNGKKALGLEELCQFLGQAYVRFDYTGCGESEGSVSECLLGDWKNDVLCVLDKLTAGPQILIGSSMGGWLMVLAALARPERVTGLVGSAAAPDHFLTAFKNLPAETKQEVEKTGIFKLPSIYSDTGFYPVKYDFIKEAEKHCVLNHPIPVDCPVQLIHGMEDEAVPWQTSLQLAQQLASKDVDVILRKTGDHRLSDQTDLELLKATVQVLIGKVAGKV
ncbi:palmitoyl-protein thioesterase ABHD10, mitochondrial-like [Protopterus annectens]|uniref:palmitoyl-protein thioesterase ABHD10, mitochondrial-like n=1 Tax=Protopterus annectens TaxID=7888 RepID=UPI001CFB383F|nr:palmitoyl-protein thioesterase ABHD10, mitochondrial-like [Protopterus annectens]